MFFVFSGVVLQDAPVLVGGGLGYLLPGLVETPFKFGVFFSLELQFLQFYHIFVHQVDHLLLRRLGLLLVHRNQCRYLLVPFRRTLLRIAQLVHQLLDLLLVQHLQLVLQFVN